MSDQLIIVWLVGTSLWDFALFGLDKWRAGRGSGTRTAEFTLCLVGALGGWPGGLAGMLLFRHKTAKASFGAKFGAALVVWMALVAGALKITGHF